MTTFVDGVEIMTEQELLAYANKLREAGAADPLGALMPSVKSDPNACLIANALNFSCRVFPARGDIEGTWDGGEQWWHMILPENISEERAQKIAEAAEGKLLHVRQGSFSGFSYYIDPEPNTFVIRLPRVVGNTANAFDNGKGWTTKYAQ